MNKEAQAVYYSVTKRHENLRTQGKCRKHNCSQMCGVFYHSVVPS